MRDLIVEFPNGEKWKIPVRCIVNHRALTYSGDEMDDSYDRMIEDTLALFMDDFEIKDWAENNMNWSDVSECAEMVSNPRKDYHENEWVEAEKAVVSK